MKRGREARHLPSTQGSRAHYLASLNVFTPRDGRALSCLTTFRILKDPSWNDESSADSLLLTQKKPYPFVTLCDIRYPEKETGSRDYNVLFPMLMNECYY